jgi:hypothetical protein
MPRDGQIWEDRARRQHSEGECGKKSYGKIEKPLGATGSG